MVEWKKLGDVCDILNGFAFKSKEYVSTGIRIIRISDVQSGYISDKDIVFYPKKKITEYKRYLLKRGDLVMSLTGNPGRVACIQEEMCALNQRVACLRAKSTSSSYLFYLFNCKEFESIAFANSTGGAQKNLGTTWLNNYLIPIPSIAEQNRIVGILDTFTDSIENLKQQIAQRRKQYAYFIDYAFGGSFSEMKKKAEEGKLLIEPLSSHGIFTRGRRFVRTDVVEKGQPCIHYGDMYTYYGLFTDKARTHLPYDFPKKMRYAKNGDVVIVGAGENNEDIGVGLVWLGDEPAAVHDACYIYEHDFEPMFVSYFLRSSIYHLQIKSHVVRGKICSISSDGIGKALIPVFPLEKQRKIVSNLLPFESLLNNLEAQLAQRQKQYEYYRNKLLTFE